MKLQQLRLKRANTQQNRYSAEGNSARQSNVQNSSKRARSDDLNSIYRPNFKKLREQRVYRSSIQSTIINLANVKKVLNSNPLSIGVWNTKNKHCQLCQEDYSKDEMFYLCACEHQYCENCLIQYVNYKVGTMEEIRCSDESCAAKVNKKGQFFIKVPQNLKTKYQKAQLWRQTMGNPNLKLCPQQQCIGQVNLLLSPPSCSTCHRTYCPQCMMQSHIGPCDQIYEKNFKQWKRCPQCRMFINKDTGCNHMICLCQKQFCFVCLSDWGQSHYQCVETEQMHYVHMDDVKHPILLLVTMGLIMPFFVLISLLIFLIAFAASIPIGVFAGIFMTFQTCCQCFYCCTILLLPFGAALGVIIFPFVIAVQVTGPFFILQYQRYKITLQGLYNKIKRPEVLI